MAGSLIQVATNTVTGTPTTVTLTGINSNDSYMVAFNNVTVSTGGAEFMARVTVGGSADSSSEYDNAYKFFRADGAFGTGAIVNGTVMDFKPQQVSAGRSANGVLNLFNFNNSSEFSYITTEASFFWNGSNGFSGVIGGVVQTEAQACDGIQFLLSGSATFATGTFTLYKIQS